MGVTSGASTPGNILRNQADLVKEGIENEFGDDGCDQTASERYGHPVQAHHCICCSVIQKHQGGATGQLAIDSGYDINNGNNNIFLPAKFGHMRINSQQRHRGGHCDEYYDYVKKKLDPIYTKYKNADPCNDPQARKSILGALTSLQSTIKSALSGKAVWLYEWSESLYNEDYREEGSGNLKTGTHQPGSEAGLAWANNYPKGTPRRKLMQNSKLNSAWYSSKGFPVPGGSTS